MSRRTHACAAGLVAACLLCGISWQAVRHQVPESSLVERTSLRVPHHGEQALEEVYRLMER